MPTPSTFTGFVSLVATGARIATTLGGRALLGLAIVAAAICIGLLIPVACSVWIASLPPAGLALGGAALLSVLRGLFESLPTAWEFVVSGKADTLPKIFSQVAVAALGLGFAYYAVPAATGKALTLNVGGSLPPFVLNESDSILTAYVTFPEKESDLQRKDQPDPQIALVNNLVDSLASCIQGPQDVVEIVVHGYASSSGTDVDNTALYKARGATVAKLITDRASADRKATQFKVSVIDWKSLQVMQIRRLFKDTDDRGTYLPDAAALNRRADILVRSAGSCLPM
jgi:hypothetical protein